LTSDKDIFAYFRTHYTRFFPRLRDRSLFVRQAANLWGMKAAIPQRLTQVSGQADDPVQMIDTLPLPVCTSTRASRDRCFQPEADYGDCAAKKLHTYGFKLGARLWRCGMTIAFPLWPARPPDIQLLDDLVAGCTGRVAADKGCMDTFRQALLGGRHGVMVVTPPRQNMTRSPPPQVLQVCRRLRQRVETVGSHLTERFGVARIRVHDLWPYPPCLIRKVLAHTVAVFLNLQLGRPPLDLAGLVAL
jgi:hypothetical protein